MKFSQMKYERPDAEQLKAELNGLTEKLKAAKSYTEAKELFLAEEKLNKHISTLANLAHIRHTIDTRDAFYDGEMKFWNKVDPELEECQQGWTQAMLESPYRKDFAEEYGNLMFLKAEIKCKTFSPVIIEELQKENELADEYEKLLASAQIPFEGGVYTLSQLTPFKSDPDDARRLAAWKAEGNWYKENQAKLDDLYDQLVHLRDKMGKKLGYEGYTTLGYYRMGRKFYDELSPETSEFFRMMLDNELLDVLSTEGKRSGGYCTSIADYEVPFIFANFNGTQHDVEVVTHEAGHAFAAYMNRHRIPTSYIWPGMEGCEVHSMSMEFLAWPWAEGFFGEDARKFRYSHLSGALTFIPYGTMVDHFQHIVFEKPDMTPRERHDTWKELLGIYMPWMKLDGDIPFYSEGEGWQRQHHIYSMPFYYIDYCLAQTVALQIWALQQKDRKNAWEHYMAYTRQGGSRVFTELLKNAGLESPFEESCLNGVCQTASEWLKSYDLTGIE